MTSVPIYLAVAGIAGPDGEPGGVCVTGAHEKSAALEWVPVTLPAGISHHEARTAVAAVLREHGWRVAGKWDDHFGESWSVTVERIATCFHCGAEIWWRIPLRFASRPDVLGEWCDTDLDDFCDSRGTAGGPHEPRRLAAAGE
jgi:hypothetical protein